MKTIITVEDGKVTVEVDDSVPVKVETSPPKPTTRFEKLQKGGLVETKPSENTEVKLVGSNTYVPTKKPAIQEPVKPAVLDKPTPEERTCEICGDDISDLYKTAKICRKEECRREKNRQYARDYWRKHEEGKPKSTITRPVVIKRQPTQPKQPEFLPGYEKSPEEVEELRPKAFNLPESLPQPGVSKIVISSDFPDPWDCGRCRTAEKLCSLHQSMEDDGLEPPAKLGTPEIGAGE